MHSIPQWCQAAVFEEPGKELQVRTLPVPAPEAAEALVRILMCTICGSDLHTIAGRRIEPTPTILGHEAIGEIVALGNPAPLDCNGLPLQIGQHVTWSVAVSCYDCDRCLAGLPQKCRSLAKYGHGIAEGRTALSGGLAGFQLLRSGSLIVPLPANVPHAVLCPANCATATVAACVRAAGSLADKRVLILGAGMLGLTACAMGKQERAQTICVVDRVRQRISRARQFGATDFLLCEDGDDTSSAILNGYSDTPFDVVLELTGAPDCVAAAIASGDTGARIILAGSVHPSDPISLDPQAIVRKCQSIRGVHNYAPVDLKRALSFLETQQGFPFDELVEATFSLHDVNRAIDYALENRPTRLAIVPEFDSQDIQP